MSYFVTKDQPSLDPTTRSQLVNNHSKYPPPKRSLTQELDLLWQNINKTTNGQEFGALIKEFCVLLVSSQDQQAFMSYFVQNNFLHLLRNKLRNHKQDGEILKNTFSLFQFLLKALKRQDQLVYFLVKINQEGFISEQYTFGEEDQAYYANFLKLMVRKVNEDHRYLTVFFNSREPHFPLLLQLLKMHNCRDIIMHTSSKLAILELSNNSHPLVQQYLQNFPFVLFYPLYTLHIVDILQQLVQEETTQRIQILQQNLKYLEDFVQGKDRYVIDMYTNSFLQIVGRYIYHELTHLGDKKVKKGIKLLKIILKYLLPQITVVKIRISLLCLFGTHIPSKMQRCFHHKGQQFDNKNWILEQCGLDVIKHCKAIFYSGQGANQSFIKTLNSYIPLTKENWLSHELKSLSCAIGFDITLKEFINTENLQPNSFLEALCSMIDDTHQNNDLFSSVWKTGNQNLMYYYLRILTVLSDSSQVEEKIQFQSIVQTLTDTTSLCLAQAFYDLVKKSKIQATESPFLNTIFRSVTQKLVHFVLTKGWRELQVRIKGINTLVLDSEFVSDIYRQIECEILLFEGLRTLLGTNNEDCYPLLTQKWKQFPEMKCEINFKCREGNQEGPYIFTILDGQFLNFKDSQQKMVNKQDLLLTDLQVFEDADKIGIMGGPKYNNFWMSVVLDKELKQYMLKQVSQRREMAERASLQLRQMRFEYQNL